MTGLPETKALDLELDGSWLTVWFNEPDNRNPLTEARVTDLLALCAALEDRRDIRAVVFRGRGGVFCAGGDLKSFKAALQGGGEHRDVLSLSLTAARVFDAVNGLPQITVMAVEGAAMAGGFGLVCVGDIVVADAAARFGLPETTIGLTPAQISPFVVQRLGHREGRRLMLLASTVSGQETVDIGLVDTLVSGAIEMDAALSDLRRQVGRCAPGAVAETKRLIVSLPVLSPEERVQMAAEIFAERVLSDEGREGVASFLEKRPPNWRET